MRGVAFLAGTAGVALICLGTISAYCQGLPEPGKVHQSIQCASASGFSYSLYLPKGYSLDRRWPAVFCFAPDGRGEVPVELLAGAAERLGLIVAGSNDSRNGPWDKIVEAQQTLWREVNTRFSVEPKRSYALGFSGGARAALHLALTSEESFAGVVSCGAFFDETKKVSKRTQLTFVLIVGREDFNFFEVAAAKRLLEKRGLSHWTDLIEGGHAWPPRERLKHALELLEASAMKKGLVPKREDFLATLASSAASEAENLQKEGRKAEALDRFRQVALWFPGSPEGSESRARAQALEKAPDVVEELRREARFLDYRERLAASSDPRALGALLRELQALSAKGGADSKPAGLLLKLASFQLQQAALGLLSQGRLTEAASCLETCAALFPKDSAIAYNRACVLSRMGKKSEALEALERAVELGFQDVKQMGSDPDLDKIKSEPRFVSLLKKIAADP